jgi:predicted dehydrogenase
MDRVRFGVIGLGNMGSEHIRLLERVHRGEVSAVCDIVPAKMDRYPQFARFESSDAMIASGLIDVALIATPHYFHTTIGAAALSAGLHVLVEKPISVHKADCERLIAAHDGSKVFGAMFQLRTDPHHIALKNLVESGELGEIRRVNWIITNWFRTETYYASGGWRATWAGEGGGVLLNQCPHNLDLLQWITGMPSKVHAFCGFGKYHSIEVEDEVTAYLEYPNGATGVFITTTGEAPGTNRFEIAGNRGKVVYENGKIVFHRTESRVSEVLVQSKESFATVPTWECHIPAHGYGGQHLEVLQNFVDAVLDGKPLIAPAPEGIRSVELANAMLYSAWTGKAVELPLDSAAYESALKEKIAGSTLQKVVVDQGPADLSASYHR